MWEGDNLNSMASYRGLSDEEPVLSLIYFGVKDLALMKYFGCLLVVFDGIEVPFLMALVQ